LNDKTAASAAVLSFRLAKIGTGVQIIKTGQMGENGWAETSYWDNFAIPVAIPADFA
jgi:hypothetical protein